MTDDIRPDEDLVAPEAGPGPGARGPRSREARPERPVSRGARRVRPPAPARAGRQKHRRTGCTAALIFLGVVAVAAAWAVWYTLYRPEVNVAAGQQVPVIVAKGSSTADVAHVLAARGVIANATMFELQVRFGGAGSKLKAGSYDLETGMDYDAVIAVLEEGPPKVRYTKVTIPEGWTVGQVAARFEKEAGISASEFTRIATTEAHSFAEPFLKDVAGDSLEGYLFPKTYEVREGATARDVIAMMLAQFGKETAGLDLSYAASRDVSEHGIVTIASIIEREASVPKDRPLVASVIYNRLAIHMRLQLDSTVMYVVGNKTLTLDDLKVESPYNTYVHAGLPPGPIASPGLTALTAAAAPAKTKYLYYIMDHKDGSQSFAVTYDEFLRLKAAAKRGLK